MMISSQSRFRRPSQQGFTLLEVIIALTVIAIGLAAVLSTVSTSVRMATGLQERTIAHWVAMNKLTEIHVMQDWPATRKTDGSTIMAEHEWFWEMDVRETPDKSVRRVEISVRTNEEDEDSLVHLSGFVGKPG
ncbi:type II secretion system minor pseudopilin GspI [Kaarinaea lacus]